MGTLFRRVYGKLGFYFQPFFSFCEQHLSYRPSSDPILPVKPLNWNQVLCRRTPFRRLPHYPTRPISLSILRLLFPRSYQAQVTCSHWYLSLHQSLHPFRPSPSGTSLLSMVDRTGSSRTVDPPSSILHLWVLEVIFHHLLHFPKSPYGHLHRGRWRSRTV